MTDAKLPRRRNLLKGAAVAAGAGAMSAPMLATAQTTTTLRFQSTWPAKDIFHEYANDFASKVNAMASGKLKIEVLPSGSVVPAFQLLEAVNKGTLDGGEIIPALDRGLLDAAEFNNATSDRILGFPDVVKNCMLQSFHQSGEQFEILFNKGKYNALPAELKAMIDYSVQAASADMSWKAIDRNSKDYIELKKQGIKFYKTPDAILRAQLESWDRIIAKKGGENPLFKKILDSQKAYAERAGQWQNDYMVDFKMAYNHYFAKGAKKA